MSAADTITIDGLRGAAPALVWTETSPSIAVGYHGLTHYCVLTRTPRGWRVRLYHAPPVGGRGVVLEATSESWPTLAALCQRYVELECSQPTPPTDPAQRVA